MGKKIYSIAIFVGLMLGHFMIQGKELEQHKLASWAKSELLTAQVSGFIETESMKDLHSPIERQQFNQIVEVLKRHCRQMGLEEQDIAQSVLEVGTREQVLKSYYKVIKGFHGPIHLEDDAISYMKQAQVIKGDEKGNLRLEEPCTVQDAILFATRIMKDLYKQTGAGAKGFMWQVSDEDNTVYLLGTIHLGREEMYPLNSQLNEILESVDQIAVEVDFNNKREQVYFDQKKRYLDGTSLKEHLDETTYTRTVEAFKHYGLSEKEVNQYKPWALANQLSALNVQGGKKQTIQTALPSPDLYIYTKARLSHKDILELEGYRFQADLFDSLDEGDQIEYLKTQLDIFERPDEEVNQNEHVVEQWVRQFVAGDIETFTASYGKDDALGQEDPLVKLLFKDRDQHMTDKIVGYLEDEEDANYLVTVGAGHMIGKTGIISQLQKLGYTIQIIKGE